MTTSLVAIVASYADRINNGRTRFTVLDSIRSETDELHDEIIAVEQGVGEPGPDGVFGEAVDIIAGALDMIRMERPDTPIDELEREVADYLDGKCQKWAVKYKDRP